MNAPAKKKSNAERCREYKSKNIYLKDTTFKEKERIRIK